MDCDRLLFAAGELVGGIFYFHYPAEPPHHRRLRRMRAPLHGEQHYRSRMDNLDSLESGSGASRPASVRDGVLDQICLIRLKGWAPDRRGICSSRGLHSGAVGGAILGGCRRLPTRRGSKFLALLFFAGPAACARAVRRHGIAVLGCLHLAW